MATDTEQPSTKPPAEGQGEPAQAADFAANPRVQQVIALTVAQTKQHAVEASPVVYEGDGWYRSRAMGFRQYDSMAEVPVKFKITQDKMLYCNVVKDNFLLWAVYLGEPNQWKFSGPGLVFTRVGEQEFKFSQNPFVIYLSPHLSVPYIGFFYMFKGFSRRKQLKAFLDSLH